MDNLIKNTLGILLGILILVSCNRPTPFDKDTWIKCEGFEGRNFLRDDYIAGNTRYKMALWLEENYNFYDKSLNEILDKFYRIPENFTSFDSLKLEQIRNDKKLKIVTKQYDPNFLIGIDPWLDTDWIEIHFDENYIVSKVFYIHTDYKTKQRTERKIPNRHPLIIRAGLEYGANYRFGEMGKKEIQLQETYNEEDFPVNEYLIDELKPIRDNFKRINTISKWSFIDKKELWESTEGGEAKFYYQNGKLEKIVTKHFGESFQLLAEYYLYNEQISFVFEKSYNYNRPVYYDTTMMRENNDNEFFGLDLSEIIEDRSYFDKGILIHKLESQDCGAPFADDYLLEEQKRIKTNFEKLIELVKRE